MRVLAPINGTASANRRVAHAVLLAAGRADADITLLNVQNQRTLDTPDVSCVVSVGANTALAADRSEEALRHAIRLCRDAHVKFESGSVFGLTAETTNKVARELMLSEV